MKGTPFSIVSASSAEGKPVDDDWQEAAYRVAQDAAMAAFRYLRSKGYCKGLDVDTLGDAKSEGALAVYPVIARYMRRYQAALSYERVIKPAHNAMRRFLRHEQNERHESLDAPKHLTIESPALSLEQSAIIHERLEAALSMRLDWPMSDDMLQWLDAKATAQNRRASKIGRGRVQRVAVA